jgi:hypothetical protein
VHIIMLFIIISLLFVILVLKARVNESLLQLQSDYDRLKILLNKEPVEKRRQVKRLTVIFHDLNQT